VSELVSESYSEDRANKNSATQQTNNLSDSQSSNELMSALQQVNHVGSACIFSLTGDEEFGDKIAYQWTFPNALKTL
jgi:hypothetical protein